MLSDSDFYVPLIAAVVGAAAGGVAGFAANAILYRQKRSDVLLDRRLTLFADTLRVGHSLFESTRKSYRKHLDSPDGPVDELRRELREMSTVDARAAVDEIRMISNSQTVMLAEHLVNHLRRGDVVDGRLKKEDLRDWVNEYWQLRHQLIFGLRSDLRIGRQKIPLNRPGVPPTNR